MDLPQLISRGRPCHEDNMTDDTCCWKKRFHWQWHCSNLSSSQQLILSDILKTERLWNNEQIWWQARGQDGWKYHAADHCQLKAANRFKSSFGINSKLLKQVDKVDKVDNMILGVQGGVGLIRSAKIAQKWTSKKSSNLKKSLIKWRKVYYIWYIIYNI